MEEHMEPEPTNGLSDEQLADLARLVDGTLPADRRAEVEARVAASPQLARIVRYR
jgi:anti-sigma factor RsiW